MMEDVLRRTDEAGIPTYLETYETRNIPFYERLGYSSAGAFDVAAAGARYIVLLRHPRE